MKSKEYIFIHIRLSTQNVEQRTIFRRVTKFRHVFFISCNFFVFYRNKFLSFIVMNSKNFFTVCFKEMTKICTKTLKIIIEKCGEIGSLLYFYDLGFNDRGHIVFCLCFKPART